MLGSGSPTDTDGWKHHCEFRFRKRLFEFGRPEKGSSGGVFRPPEQVLIVYDGSPASVALINLALHALTNTQQQSDTAAPLLPFPFRFSILVILESDLSGSPGVEGRQRKHLEALNQWTNYASDLSNGVIFPLLATGIEMALKEFYDIETGHTILRDEAHLLVRLNGRGSNECPPAEHGPIKDLSLQPAETLKLPFNETLDEHFMELRKSLKTKTEDKDFAAILKKNLANTIAKALKIRKVLLPEDQTSLAVKMFSMMSLGRGSQIANEMTFTSTPEDSIIMARPLIDFSEDDLRAYLQTLGSACTDGLLHPCSSRKRKTKIDSVERQCDDFITTLQGGYPATVSTLTRIGSKLLCRTGSRCQFCKRQLDSPSEEESSLCYGCRNFLADNHPAKKAYFRNLFLAK